MDSAVLDKIIDGLNEAQAKAVANPLQYCTKIVAGAGTGKTKIISKRFLKFWLVNLIIQYLYLVKMRMLE